MALGQQLRLDLEDGTSVEAAYDGRDIRAWEGKYGRTAIGVPMTYTMLTFFGWSAAKREGSLNGEFDRYEAFDAVCVAVAGLAAEDPEPEPLDPSEPPSPATPSAASGD